MTLTRFASPPSCSLALQRMKELAAYLLLVLSGNASPSNCGQLGPDAEGLRGAAPALLLVDAAAQRVHHGI